MSRGVIKNLAGKRFGRLLILAKTDQRKHRHVVWECQCDCGNKCFVHSGSLLSGRTQSCGCLMNESRGISRTSHHMSDTKLYRVWQSMKSRCTRNTDKNFKDYGGRGIRVCDEWKDDFQAFYDHVSQLPHFGEEGYSLDRINNDGNYEPGNVKWSTQYEQVHNRRKPRRAVLPEW